MKKFLRLILVVALAAGAGYGGRALWTSDAMRLKRVEVVGNSNATAQELVAASGLRVGIHLVSLSTSRVENQVEEVPWVAHARVERIIPSKVRITVEERRPAASVQVGEEHLLVDDEGVVLAPGDKDVLLITDMRLSDLDPGRRINAPAYVHVLKIADALPASLKERVEHISAPSVDRITLFLEGGISIIYGAAEELPDKNHAIESLLSKASADGVSVAYIDVRVPTRPAMRPR